MSGADLANRDLVVAAEAEARLIELAAHVAGDPAFGIRMAEGADPRDAGLLYYLSNATATLRQALTLQSKYIHVANASLEMILAASPGGDGVVEVQPVGHRRQPLKHAIEFHLAAVLKLLREIAGRPVVPARATFAHHRSAAIRDVERFFACPVEFGAPSDQLHFSRETLETPVLAADSRLLDILKPYVERMASLRGGRSAPLRVAVENLIQKQLPHGQARIDVIANALGVSTRTLTRRMAEEGTTFSEILDGLRRALSLQYLAEPTLSIDQIGSLLGYGDAGSFGAAFRRWTGASPSQVRSDSAAWAKLVEESES